MEFPMRLNKYLAVTGYATRRSADTLIQDKRVFVNGKVAILGQKVTETDLVELKDFSPKDYKYVLYNKPRGIVTHSPATHETDIVAQVKKDHSLVGVFPVGRLDKDSEGLIILTDDGRITDRLLNPEIAHEREYDVTVDKRVTQTFLNGLEHGVRIEGYQTKPAKAVKNPSDEFNFSVTLTEGKKHQIRRMCAAMGYQVRQLKRVRIHNLELKRLKPGAVYTLKANEAKKFTASLGLPS